MGTGYVTLWDLAGEHCTGVWDVRYHHGNGKRLEGTSGWLVWAHISEMPPVVNPPQLFVSNCVKRLLLKSIFPSDRLIFPSRTLLQAHPLNESQLNYISPPNK